MKKTWKFNYEIRMEGGEQRGGWEIKAWTAGDAIREVADILRKTAKDEKSKGIKAMSFSLMQKG